MYLCMCFVAYRAYACDVSKLIALLHKRNVPVYLISGGFGCIIEPVAAALNISSQNVFANELLFYFNG